MFNMLNPAILLLLLLATLFLPSCRQPLEKDEAEKHIRAFDNEMLSLLRQLQRSGSFKVLKEILAVENLPLPFIGHQRPDTGALRRFDFEKHKGFYEYDSISAVFFRKADSDSIILKYHSSEWPGIPVRLVVSAYNEEAGSSSLMFPLKLKAGLFFGARQTVNISYVAKLEHQLPVEAQLRVSLENFNFSIDFLNQLRRDHGRVSIKSIVARDGEELMLWKTRSKVGISDDGTFFLRSLKTRVMMFPVKISVNVDNDAIDPYAIDFVGEFNKHSRISAFRKSDSRKIADIMLRPKEGSDKIDYAFHYSDGSYVFVEDLMFTAREILNIKKSSMFRTVPAR